MWCEKCHYGSDRVSFKLDSSGNFQCLQCGTLAPPLNKNPFMVKGKGRTLGGDQSVKDRPVKKKFEFDQKGGTNTESTYTSSKDIPTYKEKPDELLSTKEAIDKLVEDTIKQAAAAPGRPVEPSIEQPKTS